LILSKYHSILLGSLVTLLQPESSCSQPPSGNLVVFAFHNCKKYTDLIEVNNSSFYFVLILKPKENFYGSRSDSLTKQWSLSSRQALDTQQSICLQKKDFFYTFLLWKY